MPALFSVPAKTLQTIIYNIVFIVYNIVNNIVFIGFCFVSDCDFCLHDVYIVYDGVFIIHYFCFIVYYYCILFFNIVYCFVLS